MIKKDLFQDSARSCSRRHLLSLGQSRRSGYLRIRATHLSGTLFLSNLFKDKWHAWPIPSSQISDKVISRTKAIGEKFWGDDKGQLWRNVGKWQCNEKKDHFNSSILIFILGPYLCTNVHIKTDFKKLHHTTFLSSKG